MHVLLARVLPMVPQRRRRDPAELPYCFWY